MLVCLAIAAFHDLKTREIPDYVNYFLIATAVFIRVLWFLFDGNPSILYWIPVSLLVLGSFSYLMYVSGQWGGGDVKIMIGIALLLSSFPGEMLPFFINFLLNTLVVGAFYGAVGIFFMTAKNIKKIKFNIYEKAILPIAVIIAILLVYTLPLTIAFLGLFVLIPLVSLVYFRKIEKTGMQVNMPVEKVTEGDWLVNDVKLNGKVFLKKRNIGVTLGDIKKLMSVKNKIKHVKVKMGIPFSPVFLISAIVTFIFGNILLRIMMG